MSKMSGSISILVCDINRSEKEVNIGFFVKTSLVQFKTSQFPCLRSYSDFLRFDEGLASKYPGRFIPILPKFQGKMAEIPDNVIAQGLQHYLSKIAAHPVLSLDGGFQIFLEGGEIIKKKQPVIINESVKEISRDKGRRVGEPDPFFDDKRIYLNVQEQNLRNCVRIAGKLVKQDANVAAAIKETSEKFYKVGEVVKEKDLQRGIGQLSMELFNYSTYLTQKSEAEQTILLNLFHQQLQELMPPRISIENRLQMIEDHEKLVKSYATRRDVIEKNRENQFKLQPELSELDKSSHKLRDLIKNTSEVIKDEFEAAENEKQVTFKTNLTEFAQCQIYYELKILELFEVLHMNLQQITN